MIYYNKKNLKRIKLMKTADFIMISFKGTNYKISIEKLQAVFSVLENRKIVIKSEEQAKKYMDKYKLYDKDFLEKINKI